MNRFIGIPFVLMLVINSSCATGSPDEIREKKIIRQYDQLLKKYGGLKNWDYSYHPMIYSVWVWQGKQRIDRESEKLLKDGNSIFQALRNEVRAQSEEGLVNLDRQRFLALIPDEKIRSETDRLIMEEQVPAVHAFARAYIEHLLPDKTNLPDQIVVQLANLYKEHPELLEVPVGQPEENENSQWRDWLHDALAGCGLAGILKVFAINRQIEGMQKHVKENFWDGRLSIAYNLRVIQLARAQALEAILRELEPYRKGGKVSKLHDWMYYNLGWSLHTHGGLYPYSKEDLERINQFLEKGLREGPLGDGEEAKTIADALGRAPSLQEAGRLFRIIDDPNLPCERKQLGYIGLARMFQTPVLSWLNDVNSVDWLRERVMHVVELGTLPCGNNPLFKFYEGVLTGFTRTTGKQYPGSLFADNDLIRIHDVFIGFLPSLKTADDRASALYLLRWGLLQPEFMMRHTELGKYREQLLKIYANWVVSTTFEGASISEQDFNLLLQDFRDSLGGQIKLEKTEEKKKDN